MFQREAVQKSTLRAKKPSGEEKNTYDGEINAKVSDSAKRMQNHLKWLSHNVCSFKIKHEENFCVSLCKMIRVKMCETTGFELGEVPSLVFYR